MVAPVATHNDTTNQVTQYQDILTPNREAAERFLTLLDEDTDAFTFQTFDEDKERKNGALAKIFHGTLEQHWEALCQLNQLGAGVFVTVNATDGQGRKTENIMRVRAVWLEADRGDEPALPMEPHITVESSPGKYHRYVLVNDAPIAEFAAVEQRLVDDYGSDPNAKDVARVLRLPGFFHRKNPDQPFMTRIVDGSGEPPWAWEKVKEMFPPVEHVRESGHVELPAPGTPLVNVAEIASAMLVIDPDMGYQDWLLVGMALHSTGAGQEAFELWDRWSQGGRLYRMGECAYRWGTFSQNGGVTVRTLFDMAWKAGWDGEISTAEEVRPLIDQQRRRMLDSFGEHHAVAMVGGKAVVVYRERDAISGKMTTRVTSLNDLTAMYKPQRLPFVEQTKNGVKLISKPLVETWMQSRLRKTYHQVVFNPIPGLVAGELELPDGDVLNLYTGLAMEPKEGDCQLILDHIRGVWCSGDEVAYQYVICWLARMVQKPKERGHTVIVLRSGEGTGKNIIIDLLVRAFGEHATLATRPDDLVGRFNRYLGTSVLVFANEAVWGGDKAQEGMLKGLITDQEITVEEKFLPKLRLRNSVHLIMASNNDWVAPVGLDDRRFVILDVSEAYKDDRAYFAALAASIEAGGDAAFLYHLMHLDISSFNPRVLPDLGLNQATKREAKVRGMDSVTQWWLSCLEEGTLRAQIGQATYPLFSTNQETGWDHESISIPTQDLYSHYQDWAKRMGRRMEHASSFGRKLADLASATTKRPATRNGRQRVYILPSLKDCRKQFEAKTKMPWNWTQEDDLDDVASDGQLTMMPPPRMEVVGREPRERQH